MTESLAFLALLLVNELMKHNIAYPSMINSYISISIVFIVFTNLTILILNNKISSAKKRYRILCIFYIVLLLDDIFAILYFSYYLNFVPHLKFAIQIFIYGTYLIALIITKYYEFKQVRNYGQTYKKFVIVELILLILLTIFDISLDTIKMIEYPYSIPVIITLFGLLALTKLIILQFQPYWYHKQILVARLSKLADDHIMDKAVIPPQREIESDAILREVKYVLEYAFIRPVELNRSTRMLYKMMIKKGYEINVAVNYSAMWSQTMICNLMKRKYDFSYLPTFIVRIINRFKFFKGNKRTRRV